MKSIGTLFMLVCTFSSLEVSAQTITGREQPAIALRQCGAVIVT